MPEWIGIEIFKNGMEDTLPYFHTLASSYFVFCLYLRLNYEINTCSYSTSYSHKQRVVNNNKA